MLRRVRIICLAPLLAAALVLGAVPTGCGDDDGGGEGEGEGEGEGYG